jgi:D-serine deaminase-like pyridoxal phosphate-dependent protein
MTKIVRPTLIVDQEVCVQNINRMAAKAKGLGIRFRPHFKTHQSAKIGEWFKMAGVTAITVSSVQMAEYFAAAGWEDITIAFPLNLLEIDNINQLAKSIKLQVLVENIEAVDVFKDKLLHTVGVWVKIDTGYNRTGIDAVAFNETDTVIAAIAGCDKLIFKGFLSHTGQTYQANSTDEILRRHFDALMKLKILKSRYFDRFPDIEISMGDTPAATLCTNFDGVNELRPGNFVFYDLMQQNLGVCRMEDIAVRLICPVVAKHASRNEVVIHGGAVHFSKDSIRNTDGKMMFGRIVIEKEGNKVLLNTTNYLSALSQEHGILKVAQTQFSQFYVGQLVEILPVHSCLTANLMGFYRTNNGELIEMMPKF